MRVICVKDLFADGYSSPPTFREGSEYDAKILFPFKLKNVAYVNDIPETMYLVFSTPGSSCDVELDRDLFREHFKSIKYNRRNSIKKILNGG